MAICEKCKKRDICKEICSELQKKISVRGVSPRKKDKTFLVDFNLLESNQDLDYFYLEVRRRIVQDNFLKEITGIDLEDLIEKCLTGQKKIAVKFLLDGYSQEEIASRIGISQKHVSILLRRAIRRLKYFFKKVV